MRHPWIDCTSAPVYVVRFPAVATMDEVHAWVDVIDGFYTHNDAPFGWLIGLMSARTAYSSQRKAIADHHARHREQLARHCFGMAYAVSSPMMRGAVSAFLWTAPPVYPYAICGGMDEGVAWLRERERPRPS